MKLARIVSCGAGVVSALLLGGCGGETLMLAGVAANTARAGAQVYAPGRATGAAVADLPTTRAAVDYAIDELDLRTLRTIHDQRRSSYFLCDDTGTRITIHLRQRTPVVVQVQVHVGLFRSDVMTRLLLDRIRRRLLLLGVNGEAGEEPEPGEAPPPEPELYPEG